MFLVLVDGEEERTLIERAAAAEGIKVRVAGRLDALPAPGGEKGWSAVLVDATAVQLDGVDAILRLKGDPATRGVPVVAFGNSLRADLLQDAKEAGADLVLARAAFHKQLPGILRRYRKSDTD